MLIPVLFSRKYKKHEKIEESNNHYLIFRNILYYVFIRTSLYQYIYTDSNANQSIQCYKIIYSLVSLMTIRFERISRFSFCSLPKKVFLKVALPNNVLREINTSESKEAANARKNEKRELIGRRGDFCSLRDFHATMRPE